MSRLVANLSGAASQARRARRARHAADAARYEAGAPHGNLRVESKLHAAIGEATKNLVTKDAFGVPRAEVVLRVRDSLLGRSTEPSCGFGVVLRNTWPS